MSEPFEGRLPIFIRQRREQLGLTQQQLALLLIDVSPADVVLLESGHLRLDVARLDQLADALATESHLPVLDGGARGTPAHLPEVLR